MRWAADALDDTLVEMLIDTHCHLNDVSFSDTLPEVISRARQAGIEACIVPAYDHGSLARTAEVTVRHPDFIFPAYGLHPWYIPADLSRHELREYLVRSGTAAVGEIGLDYSPECPPREVQLAPFQLQLDMAAELDLPVLIHCRKAHEEVYKIIAGYRGKLRGVLHSFSGGRDLAMRFIELGFFIGFSGSLTRVNAKKYHKTAQAIPLDRMLLETDAPSIATQTTEASLVEPRHALEVALKIAELRGITLEEVAAATTANVRKLFKIIPDP